MIALHPVVAGLLSGPQGARIGGHRTQSGAWLSVINPSDETPLAQVAACGEAEIDRAVSAATAAFDGGWRDLLPDARARLLWDLAQAIGDQADVFGQLDALDTGKPLAKARDVDAQWSARHLRYFAGWADKIEGASIPVNMAGRLTYTRPEPIGVCGLIVPWNYPLLMAMWKLAPALAAGNTVVLKPSEETPLSALCLADLALKVGLPPGVLNVVPGTGALAGAALVAHPGVGKIGFTGSTATGRRVAASAAATLKRVTLELGGKAANVVFDDADLQAAIPGAFWAAFGNNGQSCTAGARLYVQRAVHDKVVEGLVSIAGSLSVGPGMDAPGHDLGPVISRVQMDKVLGFVDRARAAGAQVITGGHRLNRPGWFVPPTILTGVTDAMEIAQEEVFGPVLAVLPFDDEADVLARANATPFGLAAGLWTRDLARARRMADRLQAGTIWVNCWGDTDAGVPFGGIRQSGYGREMGREALTLYTQTKAVWIA
ncbi:MAG: aldehyde dehydrogenase family protein [Gemmobacter sp.]